MWKKWNTAMIIDVLLLTTMLPGSILDTSVLFQVLKVMILVTLMEYVPNADGQLLSCYDCSGACESPGICTTRGRCFIRRDPNNLIYRGCADEERWPRLDMTYTGCRYQDYMGWSGDHVLWCFCAQSNCNSPPIGEVTSSTRRTSVPQFDQNRNNRTSPVTSYTRFPIGGTSDDDGKGQRPNTRTTRGLTTTPTGRPMSTPRDKICTNKFERISGLPGCYRIVRIPMKQSLAALYCSDLSPHARLVSIESEAEHRLLTQRMRKESRFMNGWQGWWTSGFYHRVKRKFVWRSSGQEIPMAHKSWAGNLLLTPYAPTCVWLVPLMDFKWGNYHCGEDAGAICEINAT